MLPAAYLNALKPTWLGFMSITLSRNFCDPCYIPCTLPTAVYMHRRDSGAAVACAGGGHVWLVRVIAHEPAAGALRVAEAPTVVYQLPLRSFAHIHMHSFRATASKRCRGPLSCVLPTAYELLRLFVLALVVMRISSVYQPYMRYPLYMCIAARIHASLPYMVFM